MQRAWNKYGEAAFAFEVIEEIPLDKRLMIEREQFWMDAFEVVENGYNICPIAESRLGAKWDHPQTPEEREKRSVALRGKTKSKEHNEKVSRALRGRPFTEQRRQNIISALAKEDPNAKQERYKKLAQALRGRVSPMRGKTYSAEVRERMAQAHRGKPWTEKQRAARGLITGS